MMQPLDRLLPIWAITVWLALQGCVAHRVTPPAPPPIRPPIVDADARQASTWLAEGIALLPPAGPWERHEEAVQRLQWVSELDPGAGGAGATARTLLSLIELLKGERAALQRAEEEHLRDQASLGELRKKIKEIEKEMESLKAIDLAPLPGEAAR
jgi:hypothetical protein